MSYDILHGEHRLHLDIVARLPLLTIATGPVTHTVARFQVRGDAIELSVNGRDYRGWCTTSATTIEIRLEGQTFVFQRLDGVRADAAEAESGDDIRATMPGILVAWHAQPGTEIARGAPLVTIESMKLQMTVTAPRAGTVARIHVAENGAFERNAVLVSLVGV